MNRSTYGITLSFFGLVLCAPISAQATQRLSISLGESQGNVNHLSQFPSVSADGRYVAFHSGGTDLVPGDTNFSFDVFVRDRQSGVTTRVSVATGGVQANGGCGDPSISADGAFVAFTSGASNLVTGDTNSDGDVFVHNRLSGVTERVSVGPAGLEGDDGSRYPSISADGRYVAFESSATNLVAGDTNGSEDVFLHDRLSSTTERVSVDSAGAEGNNDSGSFRGISVSADGRYVAFYSTASNLVPGDTNGFNDIFVRDRLLGLTEVASVSTGGVQGNDHSYDASISADGRYVAFDSVATTLVAGDSNLEFDVFLRDRQSSTTSRVSVSTGGVEGDLSSRGASISADGRYIAFHSSASNLVSGDTGLLTDVFVHDRQGSTTERASLDAHGVQGNSYSIWPSISDDGRCVAFESDASNLVPGDINGYVDVFMRVQWGTPMIQSCFPRSDGVIPCPCGQPRNPIGGCANFGAGSTTGAVLNASGVASVGSDTVLLTTSNHRSPASGVLNVFFSYKPGTATPTTGVASGAGVRCIGTGGSLKRLYTVQVFGGSASKPGMGDLGISAQSAALAGHAIAAPETRHYFNVYRDGQASGPCGSSATSTNLTNMGSILWGP